MDRLEKIIKIMMNEYSNTCGELQECERCIYYNGDCNLDYLIDVLFRFDKVISKEKSIVLKNIDTSDKTFINQIEKVIKDGNKFAKSVANYVLAPVYEKNTVVCKEDAIKTFWEMVQTGLGLLQKIDVDADEVMEEYPKHLQKMENQGKVEDIIKDTKRVLEGR